MFTDAFDGGGFGYSGDYFEGGPYSMIANILGINPMGSENLAQTVAQNPQPQPQQQMPFATATNLGDTNDPLAAINQPAGFPGMADTSGPIASGIPTFSEFTEGPGIKFLNARTQMQMYDALYGRSQPAPSYFTGMDASGGMRV
jgi:hypothetical protein